MCQVAYYVNLVFVTSGIYLFKWNKVNFIIYLISYTCINSVRSKNQTYSQKDKTENNQTTTANSYFTVICIYFRETMQYFIVFYIMILYYTCVINWFFFSCVSTPVYITLIFQAVSVTRDALVDFAVLECIYFSFIYLFIYFLLLKLY